MRCTNLEILMVLIVPRHWHWLEWFGKRITRSISASFVCGSSLELRVSDLWIWLIYAMQFGIFGRLKRGLSKGDRNARCIRNVCLAPETGRENILTFAARWHCYSSIFFVILLFSNASHRDYGGKSNISHVKSNITGVTCDEARIMHINSIEVSVSQPNKITGKSSIIFALTFRSKFRNCYLLFERYERYEHTSGYGNIYRST